MGKEARERPGKTPRNQPRGSETSGLVMPSHERVFEVPRTHLQPGGVKGNGCLTRKGADKRLASRGRRVGRRG